jgi:hypothetical protein
VNENSPIPRAVWVLITPLTPSAARSDNADVGKPPVSTGSNGQPSEGLTRFCLRRK